jgi:hypothetical protein
VVQLLGILVLAKTRIPAKVNLRVSHLCSKVKENTWKLLKKKEAQWPLKYLSKIFTISGIVEMEAVPFNGLCWLFKPNEALSMDSSFY